MFKSSGRPPQVVQAPGFALLILVLSITALAVGQLLAQDQVAFVPAAAFTPDPAPLCPVPNSSDSFGVFACRGPEVGLTYDSASKFLQPIGARRSGCSFLLKLENSIADSKHWEYAIRAQGILGCGDAIDWLEFFVVRGEGPTDDEVVASPAIFRAKLEAIEMIGVLAVSVQDEAIRLRARRFYVEILEHDNWLGSMKWQSPFAESLSEHRIDLLSAAFRGMGATGDSEIADRLLKVVSIHARKAGNPNGQYPYPHPKSELPSIVATKLSSDLLSPTTMDFIAKQAARAAEVNKSIARIIIKDGAQAAVKAYFLNSLD